MMLIPGPVEVPKSVLRSSAYVVNHRSREFREIVEKSEELLNKFGDSSRSVMTTGSGTTAVESMIYSFTEPEENVLAVTFGEFGNRMIESIERRGCNVSVIKKDSDSLLNAGDIENFVSSHKEITSLFIVQNETGNGTSVRNLEEVCRKGKNLGLKVLVDSVSGFGAIPLKINQWGIDAAATCSQKGLASVPGIGIVLIGKEFSELTPAGKAIPQYLDLNISLNFLRKHETPYTPSTGSFNALHTALKILDAETPEKRWKRHRANAEFLRQNIVGNGSEILGKDFNYSDTVIAFKPPIPVSELQSRLKSSGFEVAKGMGELSDKIVRVGNLGIVDGRTIVEFLNAYYNAIGLEKKLDFSDAPSDTNLMVKESLLL